MRIWLALLFLTFSANAQEFSLKGDVRSLKDGSLIYLFYKVNGNLLNDSATVQGGKFSFVGRVDYPVSGFLSENRRGFFNESRGFNFMIEPVKYTIESMGELGESVVKGSPLNDDDQELKRRVKVFMPSLEGVLKDYIDKRQKNDTIGLKELEKKQRDLLDEIKTVNIQYAIERPESYISALTLAKILGSPYTDSVFFSKALKVFDGLNRKWTESPEVTGILQNSNFISKKWLGKRSVDFEQPDRFGRKIKLSDLKGKIVLLDFWASWCKPCRQETPWLVRSYLKYKEKGFEILSVSIDESKVAWKKAIEMDSMTWINVSDLKGKLNDSAIKYGVKLIPQNFLIDKDGVVIASDLRGDELERKLRTIFKE